MAGVVAAAKRCMNPVCGAPAPAAAGGDWRKGWPLRSGAFALLCDKCGYALLCPLCLSSYPPLLLTPSGAHPLPDSSTTVFLVSIGLPLYGVCPFLFPKERKKKDDFFASGKRGDL